MLIESTNAERALWPETDAAPESIAKVHPMKTSERIASTMIAPITRYLEDRAPPLRVSSSCLSPLTSAVRMGMSPRLIEIMLRATSSMIVTNVGM